MTKDSNVADGQVAQQDVPSATSQPSGSAVASAAVLQSLDRLSLDVKPQKFLLATERWIISPAASVEDFPSEDQPVAALSCFQKDFATREAYKDCLSSTPGCTAEQREWLRNNATLSKDGLFAIDGTMGLGSVTLKNTADSAQSIAFKDIRFEGEFTKVNDAGFSVTCTNYNDWSGGAAAGFATERQVLLPFGEGTAVFGQPLPYGEDLTRAIPEGMPAVVNLAGGETSGVQLAIETPYSSGRVTGRVVARVAANDGERDISVPLPLLDGDSSVYTSILQPSLRVDGGAICPVDTTSNKKYSTTPRICSFAELKAKSNLG
ncbi:hypothetical protein [Arthrobacter globiformis]|uniref:hypothetical protein n=1 Tax=Arthrobacter globiformis TaxID=1665 RepID=UPI00277ECCC6|nr:hypothetical protein [Arthrobacter globiformis]MDQ0864476.1 hypothetical protein [Arthrobacter globiformis]